MKDRGDWSVKAEDGRMVGCSIVDDGQAYVVRLMIEGEPTLGVRCASFQRAKFVSRALRQDTERTLELDQVRRA